jgi:predicted TIM-barrel fold metal-dependent hydrolase
MIIDAHTHIHLDPGEPGQTALDLLASMDAAGIETSAVFAAPINQLTTEKVLEEIEPHAGRLFAVGSVSPLLKGYDRAPWIVEEWLASGKIRALKFYTGYEHFYPADPRLRIFLSMLVKHDRPVIFHSGDLYDKIPGAKLKYSHPLAVDELAAELPDLKIIIAHLGSPWALDAAQVCYKNKHVYADCSGFTYGAFDEKQQRRFTRMWETFDEICEGQAADKILFGSDWPISDMRSYTSVVRACAGDAASAEKIFAGNARKVFGL